MRGRAPVELRPRVLRKKHLCNGTGASELGGRALRIRDPKQGLTYPLSNVDTVPRPKTILWAHENILICFKIKRRINFKVKENIFYNNINIFVFILMPS